VSIGERLEEVRIYGSLSGKSFAEKLKITPQAYVNYSKDKRDLPIEIALKINQMFNISMDWLLTGKGPMRNDESISVVATHNSIAVGHNNSNVSINTASFDHGHEIKEIVELLQYAPSAFLGQVKERLLEFKKLSQL